MVVAVIVFGACAGDDAGPAAPTRAAVAVEGFAFAPKQTSVAAGGTVTWTNGDDFDHSVVVESLDLDGAKFGPQTQPSTFAHRFGKAGTYPYFCGVHNSMTGTVVVTT